MLDIHTYYVMQKLSLQNCPIDEHVLLVFLDLITERSEIHTSLDVSKTLSDLFVQLPEQSVSQWYFPEEQDDAPKKTRSSKHINICYWQARVVSEKLSGVTQSRFH